METSIRLGGQGEPRKIEVRTVITHRLENENYFSLRVHVWQPAGRAEGGGAYNLGSFEILGLTQADLFTLRLAIDGVLEK